MSEKSKKKIAAFADLLLLQTRAHTHTLVQVLHMLQESSSANSFSKTEVQTTTFSWRHQTPRIIQSRVKIYMEIPQKHEDKSKKED